VALRASAVASAFDPAELADERKEYEANRVARPFDEEKYLLAAERAGGPAARERARHALYHERFMFLGSIHDVRDLLQLPRYFSPAEIEADVKRRARAIAVPMLAGKWVGDLPAALISNLSSGAREVQGFIWKFAHSGGRAIPVRFVANPLDDGTIVVTVYVDYPMWAPQTHARERGNEMPLLVTHLTTFVPADIGGEFHTTDGRCRLNLAEPDVEYEVVREGTVYAGVATFAARPGKGEEFRAFWLDLARDLTPPNELPLAERLWAIFPEWERLSEPAQAQRLAEFQQILHAGGTHFPTLAIPPSLKPLHEEVQGLRRRLKELRRQRTGFRHSLVKLATLKSFGFTAEEIAAFPL
jgi:hypothetical protein